MGLNPDKNGSHAARRARANRNGLASSSLALASRTFQVQVAQVDKVRILAWTFECRNSRAMGMPYDIRYVACVMSRRLPRMVELLCGSVAHKRSCAAGVVASRSRRDCLDG